MVSLETIKKGGSMGGFFLNHGFSELGPEYKGKQGPKGPRNLTLSQISHWEILTRDLTEVLITKSVRRLVPMWLAIRQKNTVVWGDFSYGY